MSGTSPPDSEVGTLEKIWIKRSKNGPMDPSVRRVDRLAAGRGYLTAQWGVLRHAIHIIRTQVSRRRPWRRGCTRVKRALAGATKDPDSGPGRAGSGEETRSSSSGHLRDRWRGDRHAAASARLGRRLGSRRRGSSRCRPTTRCDCRTFWRAQPTCSTPFA